LTLSGQRVVVISGTSGMGLATVRAAAAQRAEVVAAGRRPVAGREPIGGVRQAQVDVTDEASVRDLFDGVGQVAMSLGVPVVGTAVEGLPAVLGDGRGVIVAPEDPTALARAIGDVLSGRIRTDLRAARRYARGFSPQAVAARYATAYRELCATSAARTAAAA
jgi:NAD(P)-dependent dehydrogenase (short-subunit alcohol dehydrogenase family)